MRYQMKFPTTWALGAVLAAALAGGVVAGPTPQGQSDHAVASAVRTAQAQTQSDPAAARVAEAQTPSSAPAPGTTFRDCSECPEMVVVPAGEFIMGSPKDEEDRLSDEGPQHAVTIARPFAVGKFHVTVDQFAAFVADTGYDAGSECWTVEIGSGEFRRGRSWRNPGFVQAGSHPAVCISWEDAKAFVAWLSRKTGKGYRLLSEAEWEYVARAGTTTRYFFGNDEKDTASVRHYAEQLLSAAAHIERLPISSVCHVGCRGYTRNSSRAAETTQMTR